MGGKVTTFRMANHVSVQFLLALNNLVRVASFKAHRLENFVVTCYRQACKVNRILKCIH